MNFLFVVHQRTFIIMHILHLKQQLLVKSSAFPETSTWYKFFPRGNNRRHWVARREKQPNPPPGRIKNKLRQIVCTPSGCIPCRASII